MSQIFCFKQLFEYKYRLYYSGSSFRELSMLLLCFIFCIRWKATCGVFSYKIRNSLQYCIVELLGKCKIKALWFFLYKYILSFVTLKGSLIGVKVLFNLILLFQWHGTVMVILHGFEVYKHLLVSIYGRALLFKQIYLMFLT